MSEVLAVAHPALVSHRAGRSRDATPFSPVLVGGPTIARAQGLWLTRSANSKVAILSVYFERTVDVLDSIMQKGALLR